MAHMAHIAYFRVSTTDQSIDAQRHAMLKDADGGAFDAEYLDEGVSGATLAAQRPGFAKLLAYIRKGDTLHIYAVDRLGRDALDVQATVRALLQRSVAVEVRGLGRIAKGAGELILAVLAQVADMERNRIIERTAAGRDKARASLAATGLTHRGKASLGRPKAAAPAEVCAWRLEQGASIALTAAHWGVSAATVKRYCAAAAGSSLRSQVSRCRG
jgi:putative DNA-invertase from lambdoid prophage Rac